jgi:long-chain acyl-CoA synthetase
VIASERYESIGELLRDALVQWKSETALIEADRKREVARYTYLELKRAAEPLARRLQDLGVCAGTRVAICMSNQSKYLISAYAAFFRGAVLVPIDYKLGVDDQEALLAHCEPHVLVTEFPAFRLYRKLTVPHVLVTEAPANAQLGAAERWESTDAAAPPPDFVPRRREDQATLVYSSGTGGRPKGCMLSHGNYLEQYRTLGKLFPLDVGDRYFSILPTNHAIDFMCGFLGPLAGGATVVHQRTLRPEFINDSMERFEITHMSIVPLILEAFERRIDEKLEELGDFAQAVFDGLQNLNAALTLKSPRIGLSRALLRPVHRAFGGHLRFVFCGGAFVDPSRARRFYELGLPVVIGYGLTEACTVLTVNDLKPFRADSVGRPLDAVEIEVRNQDAHGVGEVWVKSPTVMMGYLDDPEQTAETIVDGWLRTGDVGHLDASGQLHLVGRSKNMIVTAGGKNVYPEDIESAFDGLPCDEMVVFASNYLWPGGKLTSERLVAVVRGGDPDEIKELVEDRNRKLPDFKRVRGLLLWDDDFPRTASMKVKRGPLAEALREGASKDAVVEVGAG